MSSLSALKYNIVVGTSIYGALLMFALYFIIILLLSYFIGLSELTSVLYVALLGIAIKAAWQVLIQCFKLKISASGKIEVLDNAHLGQAAIVGFITNASFYNGLFIVLQIQEPQLNNSINRDHKITIYRDAVSLTEYRFLARLITSLQ